VISFIAATDIIRALLIPVDCTWFRIATQSIFPPNVSFSIGLVCDQTPQKLLALSPTENFVTYFRVSLFSGIALAMPVILYEIYAYIDPALRPGERRFILLMGPFVLGLFIGGMAFCYFLLLPQAINFLFNFGSEVFEASPRASDYISFVTTFILGVGLVAEMPVVIFALTRVGIVSRSWLAKRRGYVLILCFFIGAVITPTPDPFN